MSATTELPTETDRSPQDFQWKPQPDAEILVAEAMNSFVVNSPWVARLADQLLCETGTRLIDWTDHFALPASDLLHGQLERAGFECRGAEPCMIWEHPLGLFPRIMTHAEPFCRLAVRAESVDDFLAAPKLDGQVKIEGSPFEPLRKARVAAEHGIEFWAVERHGYRGWELRELAKSQIELVHHYAEAFSRRPRTFADDELGFAQTRQGIAAAITDLGAGRAADLFFAAERDYWTARNRAARFQKGRQDALGLGWANHDHHTYRSSREHFPRLIAILEDLGFQCRERFYAGREAGWGAQVLEHEESQVVIFADVDLSPEEVTEDFAHVPLVPRPHFGTVGLWCLLHGEAFLEAGMHHLECRFDYQAARAQFERAGIGVMRPFTDLPFLKQAFTAAEVWKVDGRRAARAVEAGAITAAQAEQFRTAGTLGSHLEILQRDDGYKGFNQSGINEIIRATDPRN
jgi:hypothetical protein